MGTKHPEPKVIERDTLTDPVVPWDVEVCDLSLEHEPQDSHWDEVTGWGFWGIVETSVGTESQDAQVDVCGGCGPA